MLKSAVYSCSSWSPNSSIRCWIGLRSGSSPNWETYVCSNLDLCKGAFSCCNRKSVHRELLPQCHMYSNQWHQEHVMAIPTLSSWHFMDKGVAEITDAFLFVHILLLVCIFLNLHLESKPAPVFKFSDWSHLMMYLWNWYRFKLALQPLVDSSVKEN